MGDNLVVVQGKKGGHASKGCPSIPPSQHKCNDKIWPTLGVHEGGIL